MIQQTGLFRSSVCPRFILFLIRLGDKRNTHASYKKLPFHPVHNWIDLLAGPYPLSAYVYIYGVASLIAGLIAGWCLAIYISPCVIRPSFHANYSCYERERAARCWARRDNRIGRTRKMSNTSTNSWECWIGKLAPISTSLLEEHVKDVKVHWRSSVVNQSER